MTALHRDDAAAGHLTGEKRRGQLVRGRRQPRLLNDSYHESPLLDFVQDDSASLGHPGQQHCDSTDGQPADVEAAGRRVQLVDLGAPRPEGHQPAAGEH